MTQNTSDFLPGDDGPVSAGSGQVTVQELTWALVDDHISSDEFQLLDSLLLSDDKARSEYLNCMQLHTDLIAHFTKPAGAAVAGKPPVLGFLSGVTPPLDVQPSQQ